MIVKIKSKVEKIVDAMNQVQAYPECGIEEYRKFEDRYIAKGMYFYTDSDGKRVVLADFEKPILNSEANAIFGAISVDYPQDNNYVGSDDAEILAGLKYIVASEGKYGLSISDWE